MGAGDDPEATATLILGEGGTEILRAGLQRLLSAATGRIGGGMASEQGEAAALEAVLKDGTRVHLRPIRPSDKESLQGGLQQMSPESRYRRFFAPVDHLTDEQLRYFTEVDQRDHVAWVASLPDRAGNAVVAVARYVRLEDDPEAAEAAVTVIDAEQGKGLGRLMLRVLAESAIKGGIKRFTLFVLGENEKMLALMNEAGAISDGVRDGVHEMHVVLPDSVGGLDHSAAPRILRVAASGRLQGEVSPGRLGTRFMVGKVR
jgi:RimJ/RimL family protein N-acetyltransferase